MASSKQTYFFKDIHSFLFDSKKVVPMQTNELSYPELTYTLFIETDEAFYSYD